MSCGVGCRRGWDRALLWLWRRLATTAPIRPLAWEPPYAAGAAQEIAKRQTNKQTKKTNYGLFSVTQYLDLLLSSIIFQISHSLKFVFIILNYFFAFLR